MDRKNSGVGVLDKAVAILTTLESGPHTLAQLVAANWPSNAQLSMGAVAQCATAANDKLDIDWIMAGQTLSIE